MLGEIEIAFDFRNLFLIVNTIQRLKKIYIL